MTQPGGTIGTVLELRRYPVKSMAGEELEMVDMTRQGVLGDRAYALIERESGKVASAKNPRKWGRLFDCHATFTRTPRAGKPYPPVQITLPDQRVVISEAHDIDAMMSRVLGRDVHLSTTVPEKPSLEEYWPDIDGMAHKDVVTDEAMPAGSFFDCAVVHLATTATLERLRSLYPAGRFDIRRFRPNVVVGLASDERTFAENAWLGHTLAIGNDVQLKITGPCGRCVMTTLPQGDLSQDVGILRTAVQHNDSAVGVYASVIRLGHIRRGDSVRLD